MVHEVSCSVCCKSIPPKSSFTHEGSFVAHPLRSFPDFVFYR
ncbi:MAG: DUF3330 domain-containing protein [Bacteroidetes bacterium]|nr:DUF3330 domain-containing protein [Bacteroidales bacterium]MBU1010280.1 DUF3330 domain-containing protein [Bacteroidota bacterium]